MSDTPVNPVNPTPSSSPTVQACPFPRLVNLFNGIGGLFTKRNMLIAVVVVALVGYAGYVGYSALNKTPVVPNAPTLAMDKPSFDIGELITITVKHNMTAQKCAVSWKVFDGFTEKTDWKSCNQDSIYFGSGPVPKNLMVVCSVSYLVDGEIQSFVLQTQVKIGGPLPPPPPPNPNPTPSFPNEKYGLSSFTYKNFNTVQVQDKAKLAKAFATTLDTYVASISAGTATDSSKTLTDISAANNATIASLGVARATVLSYFTALQTQLTTLDNTLDLNNIQNLRIILIEISEGLKAIK